MRGYIRCTRFASTLLVKTQDKVNSCGIACMLMINFKPKRCLMAAGMAAGAAIAAIPIPGAAYNGNSCTDALRHPAVLAGLASADENAPGSGRMACAPR